VLKILGGARGYLCRPEKIIEKHFWRSHIHEPPKYLTTRSSLSRLFLASVLLWFMLLALGLAVVALLGLRWLLSITRLCVVRTRLLDHGFALLVVLVLFLKFVILALGPLRPQHRFFLKVHRSGSLSRRWLLRPQLGLLAVPVQLRNEGAGV
jgi:hypothetical protein